MSKPRKRHSAEFKATVAVEALKFVEVDLAAIESDPKSRDDILRSFADCNPLTPLRNYARPFSRLWNGSSPSGAARDSPTSKGLRKRTAVLVVPGWSSSSFWFSACCASGDDRIHELANHHDTIRQLLGHGGWEENTKYNRQTIKDNQRLFTPEILDEINQLVVKAGHGLVK